MTGSVEHADLGAVEVWQSMCEQPELGSFGLFIGFYGIDTRPIEVLDTLQYSAHQSVICYFSNRLTEFEIAAKQSIVIEKGSKKFGKKTVVFLDSTDLISSFFKLRAVLSEVCSGLNYDPRHEWLIDISGCPKALFGSLLGFILNEGKINKASFLYGAAAYGEPKIAASPADQQRRLGFSDGIWRALTLPYFEGVVSSVRHRSFLVSIGFEGARSREFLQGFEPEKVSLIRPVPGVTDYSTNRVQKETLLYKDAFGIDEDNIFDVPAWDVLGFIKGVSDVRNNNKEQITLMILGPKPHAIGACLASYMLGRIRLVARGPQRYLDYPVTPLHKIWRYQIAV